MTQDQGTLGLRIVLADDAPLIRRGIALLLEGSGAEVAGEADDAAGLLRLVERTHPDIAVVDIRMPPTFTDEGVVAARTIRERHPSTSVVLLSQHMDVATAAAVLAEPSGGVAYLLKERVSDIGVLIDAMHRVRGGEVVLDPTLVAALMRPSSDSPIERLTPREREVLAAMAEGRSNAGIARELYISERTVESISASVFQKLGLEPSGEQNRRVQAVLAYLDR
ncbi:response regulator [Agromyces sp. SYSU T00266]|uniref:response regulator n=1 Tax=Agromyces zhanjiangensis TaxID=3158562 RepID=UPI003395F0B9